MVDELRRRPKLLAVILLVVASAAWGSTFVIVKGAVSHSSVLQFLSWRFLVASALLIAFRPRALARLDRQAWARGVALGMVLAGGYILQTYGLRHTTAAISGFLTGLQVVFTPVLGWLLLRHRAAPRTWVAVGVATIGLAIISLRGVAIGPGELLTLASAAAFALQIVGTGRWSNRQDAYGLAVVQLMTVAVVTTVAAAPSGLSLPDTAGLWGAVAATAVAATAFAFAVQSWAQVHLSATSASVVFTTEPVFAALVAWLVGEPIGPAVAIGGALVVASMLVLGLGSPGRRRRTASVSGADLVDVPEGSTGRGLLGEPDVTAPDGEHVPPGVVPRWIGAPAAT